MSSLRFFITCAIITSIACISWMKANKSDLLLGSHAKLVDLSEQKPLEPANNLGNYLGYGIGIHASDISYPKAFDDLAPKYVRMEFGPRWDNLAEKIPTGKTVQDYYEFLERNYNGDSHERLTGAQYSHKFLRDRDIEIIKIHFELPYHWRAKDGSGRFLSEHIEDLARFHTAHLKYLKANGVEVDYMELANEPDGVWNGHIPAKDYARLLKRCNILFDQHGFKELQILGPGLTFLTLHNTQAPYFEAIKEIGTENLDGWSTHIWDEAEFTSSKPEYTYGIWQPFLDRIKTLDPEKKKPIFVTEYASDITQFGDKKWASPRDKLSGTVTDTWHNAVRVIANSVTNLNRGANAIVLYRISDTHWHKTDWGMMQPTKAPHFEPKPVYHATIHALKTLPIDATVLAPTWYSHDDPITLSILHQDTSKTLDLLAVNSTETTQTKQIKLGAELTNLSISEISTMIASGVSDDSNMMIKDGILTIEMSPLAVTRATIKIK